MAAESYDFIIIGGGTAGLVLGARLSEDPNLQVLVIEAGADQTEDPRVVTPALGSSLHNTPADWSFRTVPQEGLGGRQVAIPSGRLLGGSSALNGLSFVATSKSNVDAWAQLGNPGWNWSDFAESLRKSYTLTGPSETADNGGPVQLIVPDVPNNAWLKTWTETLGNLGFPVASDPFSGQAIGGLITADSVHPTTKQRSYSASAYLEPARARDNLTVITQATVEKVLLSKSDSGEIIADGVQFTQDGVTKVARARKEVLLTAGVFNSPKLLEVSGIGNAQLLQKLGIDVLIDNVHVGENLQNHVMCGMSFEVLEDLETMDSLIRQEPSAVAAAMEAYGKQTGPFARSGTSACAQLPFPGIQTANGKQDLDQLLENLQQGVGSAVPAFAEAHAAFVRSVLTSPGEASGCYISFPGYALFAPDGSMAPPPPGTEKYFSIALLLAHPLSRGSVHITSAFASSEGNLSIDPAYFSHPLDIEILARHLRFLESITAAEPLRSQLKSGGKRNPAAPPPGGLADLDQCKDYIRRTAVGAHHFTGTCSMMPRELGGVVDAQLRVYGCKNLRVCDASIIPLAPRANPQATIYGVAEHAANLIRSGL